jgi:hypothetical protein
MMRAMNDLSESVSHGSRPGQCNVQSTHEFSSRSDGIKLQGVA